MSQNLLSLTFSDTALAEIDAALNTLETHFAGFASLSPDQRRNILKMGDKTEAFCRQTMLLAGQNAQAIPPNLNMAEAQADMTSLGPTAAQVASAAGFAGARRRYRHGAGQ